MELPGAWPKEVIDKWMELVRRTSETGLEHGAVLCYKEGKGFRVGRTCSGTACSIEVKGGCPPGYRKVGEFHTHTNGKLCWSGGDIFGSRHAVFKTKDRKWISCLGAPGQKYVLCSLYGLEDQEETRLYHAPSGVWVEKYSPWFHQAIWEVGSSSVIEDLKGLEPELEEDKVDFLARALSRSFSSISDTIDMCVCLSENMGDKKHLDTCIFGGCVRGALFALDSVWNRSILPKYRGQEHEHVAR